MSNINRIKSSLIDITKEINFVFNGKKYKGFEGDTLGSALLANDVKLIGRSFKYHRPRGIVSHGSEEPNGLVEIINDHYNEPNTKITTVELYEGCLLYTSPSPRDPT